MLLYISGALPLAVNCYVMNDRLAAQLFYNHQHPSTTILNLDDQKKSWAA